MTDTKQIIENFKEGIKTKKQHLRSCKNRENSKKNNDKISGLMLSRIEELIEIGHKGVNLNDRLLDTCVLKNINKLFSNKNDENNKDNMIGYTIDNKNNTIIKFNKSPNQLHIEQFTFPDNIEQKKKSSKEIREDSNKKVELNNLTEKKENKNIIKKIKDDYYLSEPESKKNRKKVKSNIIMCSKKLKKELKVNKNKNTVLLKHYNMNTILKFDSKDKRKTKNNDKDKDNTLKEKQKSKREESKVKDKDNNNTRDKDKQKTKRTENKKNKDKDKEKEEVKEEDNNKHNIINVSPLRRKKKSKTRKTSKITFHFNNKGKSMNKKSTEYFNVHNIQKIDINKKVDNDSNVNDDETKTNNKTKSKSNKNNPRNIINNIEKSLKSPKSKKSRKKKMIKFQTVLFPKKKTLLEVKTKKSKRNSNISNKKEVEKKINYFDSDYLYSEKSKRDSSNSITENNNNSNNNKEKINKNKIQNNLKTFKEDKNYSSDKKENKNGSLKMKDNNDIKKIKNNIHNNSIYKIKHVNNICVGRSLNKENNNLLMKIPTFSVVKPDNLISLEFNRAYERNNDKNNLTMKNYDDNLNETNIKERKDNFIHNERNFSKLTKRSKSLFCCL